MQVCQPSLLLCEGEVNGLISTRGGDVELGIEDVDACGVATQPWHCEGVVALILASLCSDRPSGYFLVGASDDEVASVHGDHVGSELAGEMDFVSIAHFHLGDPEFARQEGCY